MHLIQTTRGLGQLVLLTFAAIFVLLAAGIWVVFLRPVERRTVQGVITYKIFKPAGQYIQYPVGMRDSFYSPNTIPIAECYVFGIHVNEPVLDVGYVMNTVAATNFEVGQSVTLEYQERSLPFLWKRIYVMRMSH